MGFFDSFGKKVADAGQKTVQKTKELTNIARINSLISQEENKINNMYCQIGKLYVDMHKDDCEDEFSEMVNTVAEMEQNIREYKIQIQEVKGVQCCAKCGAEVPKGSAFCSFCGNPMPKVETPANADGSMKCPDCGAEIKEDEHFCSSCGKPVEREEDLLAAREVSPIPTEEEKSGITEKYCPNCGAKFDEDIIFCTECGTKL